MAQNMIFVQVLGGLDIFWWISNKAQRRHYVRRRKKNLMFGPESSQYLATVLDSDFEVDRHVGFTTRAQPHRVLHTRGWHVLDSTLFGSIPWDGCKKKISTQIPEDPRPLFSPPFCPSFLVWRQESGPLD